jgi:hypothetical protein
MAGPRAQLRSSDIQYGKHARQLAHQIGDRSLRVKGNAYRVENTPNEALEPDRYWWKRCALPPMT